MADNSQPIRVMIVDDHTMVRRGLALFLKSYDEVTLVGEADSGQSAIDMCSKVCPDVVLMDMKMPEMDGVTATRLIHEQFPAIRIIALTSFKEVTLIQNALQAGATGYLLKDVSADDLFKAIHAAVHGHPTLSPDAAEALVQLSINPSRPGNDLTSRELEVLALMVEGLNNSKIAGQLVLSPSTVKSHVSSILSKLQASSRSEAVSMALRNGLIT
jgi:NarL family two-component system response regulator LiaR